MAWIVSLSRIHSTARLTRQYPHINRTHLHTDAYTGMHATHARDMHTMSVHASYLSCTQGDTEAQRPAARTARSRLQACCTNRDPLRDKIREVGRGLSLADSQTGRYVRLYSRRRLCARRGADAQVLLGSLQTSSNFCDF